MKDGSESSEYRSEFGLLTPACSPVPSNSPAVAQSPRSPQQRPSTAPHLPSLPISTIPTDTHTRSHSRLAASIKSFLSRSTLASPSRFSFNSSFSTETEPPKWPRKSRPPNLDISSALASPSTPVIDVHRRYASEAVAKIYNAKSNPPPMSQDSLPLRDREPKTRNVLRRRPSASAKLKGRDRGMSSAARRDLDHLPKDASPPLTDVPLTPASALAQAYKQQEFLRDHCPPKLSIDDYISPRTSRGSGYDREHLAHSPSSSYAGFRSSAERRMQPASDDRFGKLEPQLPARSVPLHHPSPSVSSNRSLTRKVSSKWRKIKGGVSPEESPSHDRGHSKARPSLHVSTSDKSRTHSVGQSMDAALNTRDGTWSNPIEPHSRPGFEKAGPEGGKLWRLMRRISTGGLRDRFQSENAVPPVPAIPKKLLHKAHHAEHSNELVSTLPHPPSSPRDKNHTSPAPHNTASAAITSSSSNSSDVASTHFFQKSHSARSSVSSYGEAVGVSHSNDIPRHIIAPIEQLRLGDAESDKPAFVPRSPRRSSSVPVALGKVGVCEDEHAPLPLPRRQTTSGGSPSPSCSRPPSISGLGSALLSHLSGRQSQTADGLMSLSPPPRQARNSRRRTSTPSPSLLVDGMGARQLDRTLSAQSDTTARASPNPDTGTHYTYRELGAPRRPPLSEREKVDIWNDLLDRSDRAGGTLHIAGTAELMSDHLRFSMHSEA